MKKKKLKVNKDICAGCMACAVVCPHEALKLDVDNKAVIDQNKCNRCGKCKLVCPFEAIIKDEDD